MSVRTHTTSADQLHLQVVFDPASVEGVFDTEGMIFPIIIMDDLLNGERWVIHGPLDVFTVAVAGLGFSLR